MRYAPTPADRPELPETVTVSRGGELVALHWPGGETRLLTAATLRDACRCAWCRHARQGGAAFAIGSDIAVTAFEPLGGNAVHIAFSDGHRSGVFPWAELATLARSEVSA